MKHSIFKFNVVLLVVLCLVSSVAFAKGNKEKAPAEATSSESSVSEVKEGKEVKEEPAKKGDNKKKDNSAIKSFTEEIEAVEKKAEELIAKMELAYDKDDAVAYSEAKKELRALEYPKLTKEKSDEIEASLGESDYEDANWLYVHSRYYQPVLKLTSTKENFSYSSSMTANPGSDIVLPKISGPSRAMIFEGWGLTEDSVTYKAGDTLKMPVKDLTLYAVFSADPSIKEGKSLEISDIKIAETNDLTVEGGKVMRLLFNTKNTGTELIKGLNIKFESPDPLLVVLTEDLHCHYLSSADSAMAKFKVVTKASSGTQLSGTITVSDSEGAILTKDVVLTVK